MLHDQYPDNLDAGGRAFLDRVPLMLSTPAAQERLARRGLWADSVADH
jgi:hypothetical protein